jgi:hypothetical protein
MQTGHGHHALNSFETGGHSPPRQDRRAYVLLERPTFQKPTPAQRTALIEFLADLLVAGLRPQPRAA